MAYSAITTPEVAVDAPVSNPLWTKVKDNFDYLKALEARLPKAFAYVITGTTITAGSYNVATGVKDATGQYHVTLTVALADTNYTVLVSADSSSQTTATYVNVSGSQINFYFFDGSGNPADTNYSFTVFKNV